MFELFYHCSNNGDGSASVHFHSSKEDAKIAEYAEDEGWGESSVNRVTLKVEDNKLYFYELLFNEALRKFVYEWVEVKTS